MSLRVAALAGVTAVAAALGIYGPALRGALISDDLFLLTAPEIQSLTWANLVAILDPTGRVAETYVNYSPVHALGHALEIQVFGAETFGHHVVNVVLHALNACLLAALFVSTRIGRVAALVGGALFLVHPANVEAVAWISQLKTTLAFTLALGALLAHARRPVAATVMFGLALLCKPHAAFALPVLAAFEWTGVRRADPEDPPRWRWVGVWAVVFAGFALLELPLFFAAGRHDLHGLEDAPWVHLRTTVAIAARYLVMAATGRGVSAVHEPPLAAMVSDGWWLAGAVALAALAWRLWVTLRARRVEAAYWIWAAAAFAPVSQVFPFLNLMADRYLYFILPGLIGASLLTAEAALARLGAGARRRLAARVLVAAAAVAMVFFAAASHRRAQIWRHYDAYLVDAAVNYPDGITAHVLRAKGAARSGDVDAAVAALRAARERGWQYVGLVFRDPAFQGIRSDPRFLELARELTRDLLEEVRARPRPTAVDLQTLAQVHLWRDEPDEAVAALERALQLEGADRARLRQALRQIRGSNSEAGRGPDAPALPQARAAPRPERSAPVVDPETQKGPRELGNVH